MRRTVPLIAAALLLAPVSRADAASRDLMIATPQGERLAILAPAAAGARPTVIVLHGANESATAVIATSGFARQAMRRGYHAVYPEGIERRWNDLRRGGRGGADDVAFLRALAHRLIDDGIAQRDKIFLTGISNGGMMALTMACRAPELFAAVGTIIASMPDGIAPCDPKPMPLVMIAGTDDPMVPYRGGGTGTSGGRGFVRGAEETARLFAHRNGCDMSTLTNPPDADKRDNSHVARIAWSGCEAPVVLYRIEGGGHQIPGTVPFLPNVLGATNQDFVGAEVIMEFFARRP